jgi:hypothetical protein
VSGKPEKVSGKLVKVSGKPDKVPRKSGKVSGKSVKVGAVNCSFSKKKKSVYKVTTYFSLTVKRRGIFLLAGLGFAMRQAGILRPTTNNSHKYLLLSD